MPNETFLQQHFGLLIHGYTDRLELVAPDAKEVEAEETAEDIKEARKERLTTFTFALCGIAPGS